MSTIASLSEAEFESRIRSGQLGIHIGPYCYQLACDLPAISPAMMSLYADFPLAEPQDLIDFPITLNKARNWKPTAPQHAKFTLDSLQAFGPIPLPQAYAFLEWGMNWCVSLHANEYLKLHAAVVSRDGKAIIMPGVPGAGKSTLCAAMGLSGWRILSDEHALIPPGTTDVIPLTRPVSLKNESIAIIRNFDSRAVFGPVSSDTHKGSVAHIKGDLTADSHDTKPVPAHIMLFPRYSDTDTPRLSPRSKTKSFILTSYHAFNYSLMGEAGFQAMKTLIDKVACYDLVYKDLDWALSSVDQLHNEMTVG